jgi:hypothetical protein
MAKIKFVKNIKTAGIIMQDKVFVWIALATGLILSIPFSLMKFKIPLYDPGSGFEVINWDLFDFIVMGFLIFGAGSLYVLVARRVNNHKLIIGVAFILAFLWLWAELAVGVFTNWGS